MKARHDGFGGRHSGACLNVHGYSASIVNDGYTVVDMDGDAYVVAKAGDRLIDAVIDSFVYQICDDDSACATATVTVTVDNNENGSSVPLGPEGDVNVGRTDEPLSVSSLSSSDSKPMHNESNPADVDV